ncbi:MAG: 23S rRNA pseudouridine synthase [Candidatus Magnetoglobus multicellularis str. Araruama]|uniref:Pseudouridine synthase n=1 Tax=Candidatus Magnetoglobus multicellularis str. Araruama TaxID=890399 RepID=A0A1V1PFP5_9BACT|nr:MAG: 23S rRNA pseudouridine synthase [Candidatus Magnetoglobus multicellularis str. Araruama]
MQTHTFVVDDKSAQMRLDIFITRLFPQYTRSFVSRLIKTDCVHINDHLNKKTSYQVKAGDRLTLVIPKMDQPTDRPEAIPLDILYEDQDVVVINKQAGLVVHPAPGHANGTLVNALLHYNQKQFSQVERFGIVHRLDQDTTGCLIVAKNRQSQTILNQSFKDRTIEKKYCCIVSGQMDKEHGIIDFPIGRHPTNRKKMSIRARNNRNAETHWQVHSRFDHFSFLNVLLKTGRTHQIRVHLAAINHPVVGDSLYGNNRKWHNLKPDILKQLKQTNRQMLHACQLGFTHPIRQQFMCVEAPLPEDMIQLIELLKQ